MKPTPETVPASAIAEVKAFLKAQRALVQLKEHFPTAFKKLLQVQDEYNAALDAADAVVRARKVSSGPFELYEFSTNRDMGLFAEAVGRSEFERLGGVVKVVEGFVLDAKRFDALVAQDKIAPEVVAKVVSYGPRFHKPDRISVP